MNSDAFKDIEKLETDPWEAADNLRANSKLTFNDFAEPLLDQAKNLRTQNQKLRAARDLLLPRLMSGEIAV